MVVTETESFSVMGTESFSASALVTALLSTVMASAAAEGLPTTCVMKTVALRESGS